MGRQDIVQVRLVDGTLLATFLDEDGTVADLIRELVTENLDGYDPDTLNEKQSESLVLDQWRLLYVLPKVKQSSKLLIV
jgi:hypothetical protein